LGEKIGIFHSRMFRQDFLGRVRIQFAAGQAWQVPDGKPFRRVMKLGRFFATLSQISASSTRCKSAGTTTVAKAQSVAAVDFDSRLDCSEISFGTLDQNLDSENSPTDKKSL